MDLSRRGLFTGLSGIIALGVAPAIVRASSVMAIKPIVSDNPLGLDFTTDNMRYKAVERFSFGSIHPLLIEEVMNYELRAAAVLGVAPRAIEWSVDFRSGIIKPKAKDPGNGTVSPFSL